MHAALFFALALLLLLATSQACEVCEKVRLSTFPAPATGSPHDRTVSPCARLPRVGPARPRSPSPFAQVIDDVRASMSKPDSRDKPKIESALVSLPVDGRASHDSALAGAGHGSQGL